MTDTLDGSSSRAVCGLNSHTSHGRARGGSSASKCSASPNGRSTDEPNLEPQDSSDRLATGDALVFTVADHARPSSPTTSISKSSLRSGFPEAVTPEMSSDSNQTRIDRYLDQLLTRDAHDIAPGRDTNKMRRYFEVLALNTAGIPSEATLYDAAGIDAKTAAAYDRLFADLFVAERVTAWATNRIERLARKPKRYIVDPALAASAAGLTARSVLRDGGNLLGRLVDTYARSTAPSRDRSVSVAAGRAPPPPSERRSTRDRPHRRNRGRRNPRARVQSAGLRRVVTTLVTSRGCANSSASASWPARSFTPVPTCSCSTNASSPCRCRRCGAEWCAESRFRDCGVSAGCFASCARGR